MSLRLSYTLLAPFYDLLVGPAFRAARRASLAALRSDGRRVVLVTGVGSGLDLPLLPHNHRYVGLDLTRAMLVRSMRRLLNPLASRLATRLDVVFEEVLARVPGLRLVRDEPAAAGGWFRRIQLQKL